MNIFLTNQTSEYFHNFFSTYTMFNPPYVQIDEVAAVSFKLLQTHNFQIQMGKRQQPTNPLQNHFRIF